MKFTSPVSLSDKQFIAQSILPGESQAILTLEDGQTIHINKETESLLEKIDGARVHMDSTMLNYQVTSKTAPKNKPVYNKVETPRGGEYALLLSDGTKVHLNAMTSLRFPVTFDNGPRKVELEGEAYFEVCKTGQPFIVCTQGMQVEVLGTTFNISAYQSKYRNRRKLYFKALPASYHQPWKQQHTDTHGRCRILYLMDKRKNSFQRPAIGRYHENTITLV